MWSETDKSLIKQLESTGDLYCTVRFYCVFRKGSLLLALPGNQDMALATLSLYQPQSWRARCLAAVIKLFIKCKLHMFFLPARTLRFCSAGLVAKLRANNTGFGFLLGNPESDSRRIIIARKVDDEVVIDKVGLSLSARTSVSAEIAIMRAMPDELSGLLKIREYDESDHWCFYSCQNIDGVSPQKSDDDLVIGVLESWLDSAHKGVLQSTDQWAIISHYIKGHDITEGHHLLDQGKDLEVLMGISHGDFAPWNLKKTAQDTVAVIDWEHGSTSGPAAWDWIHYLLQRAVLVDRMSNREAIQVCIDWADTDQGKVFMERTGWGSKINLCVGSYLIYSNALGHFKHEGLLAEWMKNERAL